MKRIPLKEIAKDLSVARNQTVLGWCRRNGIRAFKEGKSWYVYAVEYEEYVLKHFQSLPEVKIISKFDTAIPRIKRYVPTTPAAKAFDEKFSHLSGAQSFG